MAFGAALVFGASNLRGVYEGEYYSFSLKNSIAKAKNELEGTIFYGRQKNIQALEPRNTRLPTKIKKNNGSTGVAC